MSNLVLTSFGVGEIHRERERQLDDLGYTRERDEGYDSGELAVAASCYAMPDRDEDPHPFWPWHENVWKPGLTSTLWSTVFDIGWDEDLIGLRQEELAKAGALIAAEIDRLERMKERLGAGR